MESYSTSSSSLGGPSQFYPQEQRNRPTKKASSFEKLNSKALSQVQTQVPPSKDSPFLIQPSIIRYESVEVGIRYVQNISVRNTTKSAQRIRFIAPKSPYFSLNYIPSGAIAPGLDVIAEVECQLPDTSGQYIFTDTITVVMGSHTSEIPIIANKPAPNIIFNPFLDFGLLLEKQTVTNTITFENRGLAPAVVQFKTTRESKFILEPLKTTIQPNTTFTLNLRCDTRELGTFREIIPMTVTGLLEEMTLDLSAHVLNQKLNLMSSDKKTILDHLDFGTVFYGQVKEIRAVLVNTGPLLANYTIGFQDEIDSDPSLGSTTGGGAGGGVTELKSISITPLDGTINPFSEIPIIIKYLPQMIIPNKGFIKQHLLENAEVFPQSYRVNIDAIDLPDQSSQLMIHGSAAFPIYKLSSSILRFGTVPLNDHRDILLSLQSSSPIAMKFLFTKGAQFKFTPSNGTIHPGQTISILASLFPVQLGEIKKISKLLIEDGIRETEIRLIGDCTPSVIKKKIIGGTNLLPDDFQHIPKYVDPIEVNKERFSQTIGGGNGSGGGGGGGGGDGKNNKTFHRIPPWNSQEFLSSTSWDEVYESTTGIGAPVSANNDPVTYSLQELQRRSHQKETYTQYLRQSHTKRMTEKSHKIKLKAKKLGRNDPCDPLGVDMGMEKGLGDGPILKIPLANEPLWLANNGEKGGDKKKFQFDENRLITKKAKEGPTNQAEQRDCCLELTPDQLRHVIPSHKVVSLSRLFSLSPPHSFLFHPLSVSVSLSLSSSPLPLSLCLSVSVSVSLSFLLSPSLSPSQIINFGKVCVNSINYKNFVLTNELSQMVLIKLNSLESEVRGSKPLAQVLQPNGGIIGFDIQFICREVGKYKKTFGWSINDRHSLKVTVIAEVIPIELTLDTHQLTMEFSNESLEKSQTEKIIMTNPGNAIAEYVWGNRGAFRCVPEQGNLSPGQSLVVTVIWTPDANCPNTEDLSLLVTGGIEQILSLTGILNEGKISFEEKKLSIGTIAVGSEKKYSVTLRNSGHAPTVFFINDIPTSYAIDIKPNRHLLYPDDTSELEIWIKPKQKINYENKMITVSVRGGKTISLKLSGEAVIPKVHLEQSLFHFGHVVTGSRQFLPFTLTNIGTIDVVLLLDFHQYPDFKPCLTATDDSGGDDELSHGGGGNITEDCHSNILEHLRLDQYSSSSSSSSSNTSSTVISYQWKLVIRVNTSFNGYLIFAPSVAKTHHFKLPLTIQGIPSDGSSLSSCQVTADGLLSRLNVSSYIIDFQDRVVARDPSSRMSYFKEIVFKNIDLSAGLSYEIREPLETSASNIMTSSSISKKVVAATSTVSSGGGLDDQPVFFVSPRRGDLSPNESSTIRITFLPKLNGDYMKVLHIFISGQPDLTRPYFTLLIRGSGVYPRLSFSKQRLFLPPVPLNIISRVTCLVYNQGYDSIILNYRVSPTIPIPLSIIFPDGNELGLTKDKCSIIISARCEISESWIGKIEFYDTDGEKFFLEISGCSDSSLLTVDPFLRSYHDKYGFLALDDQPVRYCSKKEIALLKSHEVKMKTANRKKVTELSTSGAGAGTGAGVSVGASAGEGGGNKNVGRKTVLKKTDSTGGPNGDTSSSSEVIGPLTIPKISLDDLSEGVDVSRNQNMNYSEDIAVLVKWLNQYICKKYFDVENLLDCILKTSGDIVVDCIEQLSGKKIAQSLLIATGGNSHRPGPGGGGNNSLTSYDTSHETKDGGSSSGGGGAGGGGGGGGDVINSLSYRLLNMNKLLLKYSNLLTFLTRSGGLVLHIHPSSLLNLDDHLLCNEIDLKHSEGVRLTQAMLKDKRQYWHHEWNENCLNNWSHLLFQSYKIFILYRITYKDYMNTPGVVITQATSLPTAAAAAAAAAAATTSHDKKGTKGSNSAATSGGGGGGGGKNEMKKKKIDSNLKCPPELQASNIFSQSEAVVLAWISYHQLRASRLHDTPSHLTPMNANSRMPSMNRRIIDPTIEFNDFFILCQVIHSHLPDSTLNNGPLMGYTFTEPNDKKENFDRLHDTLVSLRLNFNLDFLDFQSPLSGRSMMILLVHFFLNLPNFIPKTVIEFKGSLSTPILKTIELRNPSKKMVCYDVTLTSASSDYQIEHQSIVLEPETVSGYTVTCTPHFSKPSRGKLTFWGIREHGIGGSTLVFELVSKVTDRPPLQVIKKTCSLFDHELFELEVTNPFPKDSNFSIQMIQQNMPLTVQQYLLGGQGQGQMAAMNSFQLTPKGGGGGGGNGGGGGPLGGKRNSVSGTNQAMAALLNEVNGGGRASALTTTGGEGGGSGGGVSGNDGGDDQDIQKIFTEPFWMTESTLFLTANETKKIHLHMMPFLLGTFTCQLIFVEPTIGEFCYTLTLTVTPPKPMEELSFDSIQRGRDDDGGGGGESVRGDGMIQKVIKIASSNSLYEKAVLYATEARLPLNRRVKARVMLQNMIVSTISNEETGQSQFGIEMDNNFFQPQKEFGLVCVSSASGPPGSNSGPSGVGQQGRGPTAPGGSGGGGAGGGGGKKYQKVLKNSIEPYSPTDSSLNSILFSFFPERAGIYKTLLIIYSLSNQYDIRCLLLSAKIIPSNTSLSLIFKGPARQKLIQEIPLTNESDTDWNLQAIINGKGFSGPKTLLIPSKGHVVYTLTYIGNGIGESDGTLLLKNLSNSSSDSYDFKLKGIAEEPLAEKNLKYSLRARHPETFKLKLPYTSPSGNGEAQVMTVETDIQYLSGDTEIMILPSPSSTSASTSENSPRGMNEYSFTLNCPVGGHMTGSLTFKDKYSNQMVWYTLDIDITSPSAESTIEVEAEVRKAVAVEITLENPTLETLVFDVVIEGDGLLGDTTFTLPPPSIPATSAGLGGAITTSTHTSSTYELIYSPLRAGEYVGSITFMNDMIGEFWYKVVLTAHAASPITVKMIECMIGTTGSLSVSIENPLSFPITCVPKIEDTHHFSLQPEGGGNGSVLTMGPYAQSSFQLFFTPSSLNEVIDSVITLTNKSLGDLVYHVSGKGLLPGVMPVIPISAPMNEIGSHTILFRNPFSFPLPLDIILTENSHHRKKSIGGNSGSGGRGDALNAFSLLVKKSTGLVVAPETSLQTAISFQPTHLGDYSASVEYRSTLSGRNLLWCYPLQGIAEAGVPHKLPLLAIECKSSLLREVRVPLIGLIKGDLDLSAFTLSDFILEVKPRDKTQASLISRTFRVQLIEIIETAEVSSSSPRASAREGTEGGISPSFDSPKAILNSDYAIVLRLLFEPLKSFRGELEILIKCQSKGQWRADLQLEALDPPPDDSIALTAAVGESDKVAFRLTNRFLGYSPFEAYFTARSSPHFVVSPSSGVLAPFGSSEGTQFVITFTPKEYGIREM
jgi:hypothetical protein